MNTKNLDASTLDLLGKGHVKESTRRTYSVAWKRYATFCNETQRDPEEEASIANWIGDMNASGLNNRTVRVYCVAVCSSIEFATSKKVGQAKIVEKTLKALALHGRSSIKNEYRWDVRSALESLSKLIVTSFMEVAAKAVFLVALTTSWRPGSDLSKIILETVSFDPGGTYVSFQAVDVKEGGAKYARLVAYHEPTICPVKSLRNYVDMAKERRLPSTRTLFITRKGGDATTDTLRRWMKWIFSKINIDLEKFKPHSTRATSGSTKLVNGLSLKRVLRMGSWRGASTFRKFYLKEMVDNAHVTNGIHQLLQSPIEVLPSNNEVTDVVLRVIRKKATATTPPTHPAAPETRRRCRAGPPGKRRRRN